MPRFEPCHGKDACCDDGECCLTCGRSLSEPRFLSDEHAVCW